MSRIKVPQDLANLESFEQFRRYASQSISQIVNIVNGSLSFGDNVNVSVVSVEFVNANQEVKVPHGLGRAPLGWFVSRPSVAMQVYVGVSDDTAFEVYVRSSVVGTCTLVVF